MGLGELEVLGVETKSNEFYVHGEGRPDVHPAADVKVDDDARRRLPHKLRQHLGQLILIRSSSKSYVFFPRETLASQSLPRNLWLARVFPELWLARVSPELWLTRVPPGALANQSSPDTLASQRARDDNDVAAPGMASQSAQCRYSHYNNLPVAP